VLLAAPLFADTPERSDWTATRTSLDVVLHSADSSADATGELTITNEGRVPLSQLFLQLTGTSKWKSIARDGVAQAFTEHKIKSDADHTGEMNEARITLAHPLGTGAVELFGAQASLTRTGSRVAVTSWRRRCWRSQTES